MGVTILGRMVGALLSMTFKFVVTTSPAELGIPEASKAKASARLLQANLAQMRARLDARGQPLPEGVDLRDTGALQASGGSDATGYYFAVEYAEAVDNRYHFAGVAPSNQATAEAEISSVWDSEPLEIIER